MSKKSYDAASRSKLEPCKETIAKCNDLRERLRRKGYTIVYSTSTRASTIEAVNPVVCKLSGVEQVRLSAGDTNDFRRLEWALTLQAERAWLRSKLAQSDELHKTTQLHQFDEFCRLFPGSRFVERRQTKGKTNDNS